MRIGIALPHYDFSFPDGAPVTVGRIATYATRAEAAGYDAAWISDHLYLGLARYGGPDRRYGTPEALTLLAALIERAERIRLGTLVLCAPFRPAALVAVAAAGMHEASRGRVDIGLGAGWNEAEFRSAGVPFGGPRERIARLGSYAGVVRAALDAGRSPDDAAAAPPRWAPPSRSRPAVWVGGKGGPRIMRVVAEHADGWNVVWRITPEAYAQRLAVLRKACDAAGRDPATVRLSVGLTCLVGSDGDDVARRYERLQRWAPSGALDDVSLAAFAEGALVGTPDECALRIKEFASLGVEEIIVSLAHLPFAVHDDEQFDLVASELLPLVR